MLSHIFKGYLILNVYVKGNKVYVLQRYMWIPYKLEAFKSSQLINFVGTPFVYTVNANNAREDSVAFVVVDFTKLCN